MANTDRILQGLNPQQREAVACVDGPLLVLAGAGSGKTRMLTHRIAYLIASGAAQPWQILAVTFTNKAAREMRDRVDRLLEASGARVWVSTFHSTCVRILRRDIGHLGYKQSFVIYDDSDQLAALKRVLRGLELDERAYPPRAVRSQIDRMKSRGLWPDEVARLGSWEGDRIAQIYQRYQRELALSNALDFGDLILLTVRLFENHPGVLADYRRRWPYLLVDEYQDTNPVQYRLLRLLAGEERNLCVVGDEDQSIYRFREADIRNILDFEKDFPGAAVVRLEQNYRSTQSILDAASAVVANNLERKGKRLFTERRGGEPVRYYQAADDRGEAAFVVGEVLRLREQGCKLADAATFYRTHAQSRPFEEELLKYNLPYAVVGGTRFYDRAEIRNALAYLRVLRNPDDTESLLRVVNTPARGVGSTTLERMLILAEDANESLYATLRRASAGGALRGTAGKGIAEFFAVYDDLRDVASSGQLALALARVLERSGYLRALEREASIESEARLENLTELLAAAEEFERQNRDGELSLQDGDEERNLIDLFLEQVTLLAAADDLVAGADRIALLTAHVAKGLEFPTVFLVGMEEGLLPHHASLNDDAALEEERRLCYVGMTRAMERLYLTNATVRRMYGSTRYNPPSRFLDEVPSDLMVGRSVPRPRAAAVSTSAPTVSRSGTETRSPTRGADSSIDYSEGQWEPGEVPPLRAGARVEHPIFGTGTLEQVMGGGSTTKARIRFDRVGVKTIVLRYVQLRLLS